MEYFYNYIWEQGMRNTNEDSLCIVHSVKNSTCYFLAVVCDGIGGLNQGEDASSYVTNSIRELFLNLVKRKERIGNRRIRNMFYRKIYQIHKKLEAYGKRKEAPLGTTLSMLIAVGKKGYVFHVGDSAVFAGKRRLKCITPIQKNDAGALLCAIGRGKSPGIFCKKVTVRKGSVWLLASDGFYKNVKEDIGRREWVKKAVCDEKEIGELLQRTKKRVQELGERDNISAICLKVL